jgi:GntR family transcriptional regulator, transcriptional repressor for pyruvate dehydrogenase complex
VNSVSTAGLKPLSRTTLSEQVTMQLASELTGGHWKPGEKLPSEAELCKAFNVGRSTLREALKSLAFIGLIRMRAGGGSYVSDQPSKYLDGLLFAKGVLTTEKDITDFTEARILLETEVAGLCAQRASEQDFEALDEILKDMKTAIEQGGEAFWQLDLGFHLAIAQGSKNQVLSELLKHIREALQELITKSLLLPAGTEMAYKQHREIFDALRQRNSARARKAMRGHLRAFQRGYKVLFHMPQP